MRARSLGFVSIGLVAAAFVICGLAFGADMRSYVSGNLFLTIDGVNAGFIKAFSGGGIFSEVINEPSGPSYFTKKHIGQPRYEPVSIQVGFSNAKGVYDWIRASWNTTNQYKNVRVTQADFKLEAKSVRDYQRCLIEETTIPAMDSTSREPAYMTLKLVPETIREEQGDGSKVSGEFGKNEQKIFLPSNFKLEIDGLDCTKVNKIDAFTVKRQMATDDIGAARDSQKEPGKMEFPDLKITVAEVSSDSWKQWFDDFVVKGNNDESKEKSGTLTLLSADRAIILARINFHNMGIYRIERAAAEANSDQIARVTVDLYVESMDFQYLNKVIQ